MESSASPPAPAARAARYWLRDGSQVTVRQARWSDEPALARMLAASSPPTRRQRFFGLADPARAARRLAAVAAGDLALVAESERGTLVAHAAWYRTAGTSAEVAFIVRDDWQSRGVASLLLSHLAEAADRAGLEKLVASVLPDNRGMLTVFGYSGLPIEIGYEPDVIRVSLLTTGTPLAA